MANPNLYLDPGAAQATVTISPNVPTVKVLAASADFGAAGATVDGLNPYTMAATGAPFLNPYAFGALGNGESTSISNSIYGSTSGYQNAFPAVPGTVWTDLWNKNGYTASATIDWVALQLCLCLAKLNYGVVRVGAGNYSINLPLNYINTSGSYAPGLQLVGDGMGVTVFTYTGSSGNACINLDGQLDLNGQPVDSTQQNALLSGFSICGTSGPGDGIRLSRQLMPRILHVEITGITNGIVIPNQLGSDTVSMLEARQVYISGNSGWGIIVGGTTKTTNTYLCGGDGVNSSGGIFSSVIQGNTLGGAQLPGQRWHVQRCDIENNHGQGGIFIPDSACAAQTLEIDACNFSGNTGSHICLVAPQCVDIRNCVFVMPSTVAMDGVQVGVGSYGECYYAHISNITVTGGDPNSEYISTVINVASSAYYTRIADIFLGLVSGGSAIPYTDGGNNTVIEQGGKEIQHADKMVVFSPPANPYTPLLSPSPTEPLGASFIDGGVIHKLIYTSSGAYTINIPMPIPMPNNSGLHFAGGGLRFTLDIVNGSSGANKGNIVISFQETVVVSSVTLAINYQGVPLTIAPGFSSTAEFYYNITSYCWEQLTSWATLPA